MPRRTRKPLKPLYLWLDSLDHVSKTLKKQVLRNLIGTNFWRGAVWHNISICFSTAEFRYEAVIVIHKDLPINNLDQLKGLKSCHTGINRNVGYKVSGTYISNLLGHNMAKEYS